MKHRFAPSRSGLYSSMLRKAGASWARGPAVAVTRTRHLLPVRPAGFAPAAAVAATARFGARRRTTSPRYEYGDCMMRWLPTVLPEAI